ncbi:hypothetical protein GCM10008026_29820 [Chelatococcus composti]|nr:hypothetical protein GCM10008026_29820 [Chelatococcus composti]
MGEARILDRPGGEGETEGEGQHQKPEPSQLRRTPGEKAAQGIRQFVGLRKGVSARSHGGNRDGVNVSCRPGEAGTADCVTLAAGQLSRR